MRAGATLYPLQHGAVLIGAQENVLAQQRAAVQGAAIVMQSALIFIVPRSEAAAKQAAPAEETTIQ